MFSSRVTLSTSTVRTMITRERQLPTPQRQRRCIVGAKQGAARPAVGQRPRLAVFLIQNSAPAKTLKSAPMQTRVVGARAVPPRRPTLLSSASGSSVAPLVGIGDARIEGDDDDETARNVAGNVGRARRTSDKRRFQLAEGRSASSPTPADVDDARVEGDDVDLAVVNRQARLARARGHKSSATAATLAGQAASEAPARAAPPVPASASDIAPAAHVAAGRGGGGSAWLTGTRRAIDGGPLQVRFQTSPIRPASPIRPGSRAGPASPNRTASSPNRPTSPSPAKLDGYVALRRSELTPPGSPRNSGAAASSSAPLAAGAMPRSLGLSTSRALPAGGMSCGGIAAVAVGLVSALGVAYLVTTGQLHVPNPIEAFSTPATPPASPPPNAPVPLLPMPWTSEVWWTEIHAPSEEGGATAGARSADAKDSPPPPPPPPPPASDYSYSESPQVAATSRYALSIGIYIYIYICINKYIYLV